MKCAAIFGLILALAATAAAAPPKVTLTSTARGTLPQDYRERGPTISPDCSHIAFLTREDGRMIVIRDGVPGPSLGWVINASIGFSPDSKQLSYVVQANNQMSVVVDDKIVATYKQVPLHGVTFSPDSRHVAYAASNDGKNWMMVLDGKPGKEYARVCPTVGVSGIHDPGRPRFSADSSRFGYGAEADGKAFFVIDGKESDSFQAVLPTYPIFSHDGKRMAFAVREAAPSTEPAAPSTRPAPRVLMFIDGKPMGPYNEVVLGTPVFGADSQRYAFPANLGGKFHMITEAGRGPVYELVGLPVFSPDSKQLAFAAVDDGKRWMIVDDTKKGPFDGLALPVFSPDSRRLAFHIIRGGRHVMWIDGKEIGDYEAIADPTFTFSPDSSRYAFAARLSRAPTTAPATGAAARITTTAHMVVDGVASPAYDTYSCPPVFSPDSKHVVYVARRGDTQFFVVDGQEVGQFDMFIMGGRVVFDSPTTFHALVVKGKDILRMQGEIQ